MEQQNDFFNEYYESIKMYKWMGVKDLSEEFDVSERTIFQWLKDLKENQMEEPKIGFSSINIFILTPKEMFGNETH